MPLAIELSLVDNATDPRASSAPNYIASSNYNTVANTATDWSILNLQAKSDLIALDN